MAQQPFRIVERDDPEYPAMLAQSPGAPKRLWVRGARLDRLPPFIAVVGTRTPTPYGRHITHDLSSDLAVAGFCIVSGLARGLDGCAHEGALDAGGTTVAVLGTPIDVIHPRIHLALAERIEHHGAIVSELPPGAVAYKSNFPARNRIIAGMSHGVVVVQARIKSGALQTADLARESGRVVFAVPGPIDEETSLGPHDLLRDGAKVCAGAGDVLAELGGVSLRRGVQSQSGATAEEIEALPGPERTLLTALGKTPRTVESIAIKTRLPAPQLLATLTRLEMAGLIAESPSGGWVRM